MSYPQPRPAFPDSAFPAPQPQPWQQPQQPTAAAANMDFWTPAQAPQPQMPGYVPGQQTSPPQPAYAEPWQQEGARQRPLAASHVGGAPTGVDPNGQVPFMPAQFNQVMANPMAGMALDFGKQALGKNLSWVMSFLSALRYYFHVNNRYVVAKLRVLLLPLLHSNWQRERVDIGGSGAGGGVAGSAALMGGNGGAADDATGAPVYKMPRDDVNAPDLYIPTMAFVTLILAMGYALGTAGQFHPEVLGLTASRALVVLFFEVLALKLGLYLISVGPLAAPPSLLDLVAYASYKFVHCIVMICMGLLLGSLAFYASIVLLGATAALFTMRTMKRVCQPAGAGQSLGGEQVAGGYAVSHSAFGQGKHRRNYFLLIVGGAQILFSWFLVRTANQGF